MIYYDDDGHDDDDAYDAYDAYDDDDNDDDDDDDDDGDDGDDYDDFGVFFISATLGIICQTPILTICTTLVLKTIADNVWN